MTINVERQVVNHEVEGFAFIIGVAVPSFRNDTTTEANFNTVNELDRIVLSVTLLEFVLSKQHLVTFLHAFELNDIRNSAFSKYCVSVAILHSGEDIPAVEREGYLNIRVLGISRNNSNCQTTVDRGNILVVSHAIAICANT